MSTRANQRGSDKHRSHQSQATATYSANSGYSSQIATSYPAGSYYQPQAATTHPAYLSYQSQPGSVSSDAQLSYHNPGEIPYVTYPGPEGSGTRVVPMTFTQYASVEAQYGYQGAYVAASARLDQDRGDGDWTLFLPHIETALIAQHNCPLGSKLLRRLRINTPRINILRLSPTKVSRTMVNGNVHNVAARFLRRRQCRVIFHEAASETHPDGLACGGEAGMPPDQRCLLVRPCLYVLDAKQGCRSSRSNLMPNIDPPRLPGALQSFFRPPSYSAPIGPSRWQCRLWFPCNLSGAVDWQFTKNCPQCTKPRSVVSAADPVWRCARCSGQVTETGVGFFCPGASCR
ncbi:hypothetical protein NA56DRAFT_749614 [Hyaloscypha hepaticicola]|uniref:Uncharacterized protein n=1 Tax=Hyaloscypha hepaticicola TaxID=2082293 RepID=A0A2J6Q335_9HELO|nr:hypothetical protein NA56DRAFT_749614 [Hyaloscypha hepaticicola]